MTSILVLDEPTPSSYIRNSVLSLLEDSFSPSPDLLDKMESISSKNIMLGDWIAANAKRVLISFSLSPIHLDTKALALILKNVDLHSVATAFANIVFPFPGGPYNKMPLVGARRPTNISGLSYG